MSGRYYDFNKGSSRSTRDDSRTHRPREDRERRTRSRSPRHRQSPSRDNQYSATEGSRRKRERALNYEDKSSHNEWEDSDEEVPAPPPPPRITKISLDFSKPKAPIKMNLSSTVKSNPINTNPTIASVFKDDDDEEEPEEMPAEARMRMRNIGRETPTSAGPNSFGKTKQGFCDSKKVFEKNLKQALETAEKPSIPSGKFPQTIYKIKGP